MIPSTVRCVRPNNMKQVAIALSALTLAGCGGWSRPNTSEAQFYQDRVACEQQAASTYPVSMTSTGGYQAPSQTRCTTSYGVTNCTTTPGVQMPGVTSDMNAIPRAGMFDACMRGRGYAFSMTRP